MPKPRKRTARQSQLVKCKGCPIQFIPGDRRQKFHDAQCREKYYLEHYGSPPVTKTCANPKCGNEFTTTMPKKQDYCKPECREEHRRDKQDELKARVVAEKQTFLGERYATLERDGFRCVYCGKGPQQGAVLDILEDQGELKTACLDCKAGREFLGK